VPVAPPQLTLLGQDTYEGGLRLRLQIRTNGAESVTLIAPASAPLKAAGVNGNMQPLVSSGGRTFVRCAGRSCNGAIIDVVLSQPLSVTFTLVGTRPGLPPEAAALVRARPENARPQYGPDSTISIGTFQFNSNPSPPTP
jgi:hypothetical protein